MCLARRPQDTDNDKEARWLARLVQYDLTAKCSNSITNVVANPLSRGPMSSTTRVATALVCDDFSVLSE